MKIKIASNFELDVQKHLIDRGVSILGIRGSGKSYTSGKICEELVEKGQPIIVIDLMSEYHTLTQLRDRHPMIIAALGDLEYADIRHLTPEQAPILADFIVSHGISLILDLSQGLMLDRFRFLGEFLESLLHAEEEHRRPYVLVMDEAHRILPEKGVIRLKSLRKVQEKVAYYCYEAGAVGRHYGLGFIVVARRSAEISKMILSQTEIRIIHKLVDPTDLNYIGNWLTKEQIERVRGFRKGEAVIVGLEKPIFIKVSKRKCPHGGGTPIIKPIETPDLAQALKDLSSILSEAKPPSIEAPSPQLQKLIEHNRTLETQLSEAQARIASLEAQLKSYSKRIKELESQLITSDEYRAELEKREEAIRQLQSQVDELREALKYLDRFEALSENLYDLKDLLINMASILGVELFPEDYQKLIEERDRYKQLYEGLKEEAERRARLEKEVLNDESIKDWVRQEKIRLTRIFERRSAHKHILHKIMFSDPSYSFRPEDFTDSVSAGTAKSYLNELAALGYVMTIQDGRRTRYRNAFPFYVMNNVRRIRPDAPDTAVNRIIEELKEHIRRQARWNL